MKTLIDIIGKNGFFCDGDWIEKKDQDQNGEIRLIQLADIGDGVFKDKSAKFITEATAQRLHCTAIQKGDILIARLPDPLGRACIFPLSGKYITAVDVAILHIENHAIDTSYIMHMINSHMFRKQIAEYQSGTTRKRISRKNLEKIKFEIPTLGEQQRIVARIEELFSELDNGVETLKKIKQQLVVYRQAVLKEAFSNISERDYRPLQSVMLKTPQNGLYKPKSLYGEGTKILRIDGFYDGQIIPNYDYKRVKLDAEEITKYALHVGDIIVNRVNSMSYLGKCALIRNLDELTVFESNIMRFRLDEEKINLEYAIHYLASSFGRDELIKNAKQAVNQASINQTDVGNALIAIPDNLKIQEKIVRIISSRLSVCDSIEKTVDNALAKTEAMRQSILKKAFEGGFSE